VLSSVPNRFVAIVLGMILSGFTAVIGSMLHVTVGHLRLMGGVRVILFYIMLRGLPVMLRGALVMFGRRAMMLRALVTGSHDVSCWCRKKSPA